MREFQCLVAWASMDHTQGPAGIQQPCLSAGEAPGCLQVRLSPCWGVFGSQRLPQCTQNCCSVTAINACPCGKDNGKCNSILEAITKETPSAEGHGFGFIHHTCLQQELTSCLHQPQCQLRKPLNSILGFIKIKKAPHGPFPGFVASVEAHLSVDSHNEWLEAILYSLTCLSVARLGVR